MFFMYAGAYGYLSFFFFFRPEDEYVWDFLSFGPADFSAEFVGVSIDRSSDISGFELLEDFLSVGLKRVVEQEKAYLLGCEPSGEVASEVFNEQAAEAFQ